MQKYKALNLSSSDIEAIETIKTLSRKNPVLSKTFVKFYLNENVPVKGGNNYWGSLENMYKYIQQHKQQLRNYLPMSPAEYETFEQLSDDIRRIQDKVKVKKEFIDKLPSGLRKAADIRTFSNKDIATALEFLKRNAKQFRPPEESISLRVHMQYIRKRLRELKNTSNITKLRSTLRFISRELDDVDLIYDENNIMVFRTIDPVFIKKYGSHRWCIVYAMATYFYEYVCPSSGITQYVILNFNYSPGEQYYRIGISLDGNGEPLPGGCQDNFNFYIELEEIYERFGLPEDLIKSYKYDEEVIERSYLAFDFAVGRGNVKISEELFNAIWPFLVENGDVFVRSVTDDKIFRKLIDSGVNVNIKNKSGVTALHVAAKINEVDKVKILLEKGTKVNIKDRVKNTPLLYACSQGSYETAEVLIENGAELHAVNKNGSTPLIETVINDEVLILKLFIKKDKGLFNRIAGEELLSKAIEHSSFNVVRLLFSEGFSPNVTDRYGNSSIMKAVRSKDIKSLRSFLKDKININAQNKDKDTALLLAVKGRQKEIADILLSVKVDVNLQDAAGNSVLHYACKYDDRNLVEKLLQKGAMVFLKNAMNQTPINIAMQYDRKFLVKQMLKHIDKTTGMYKKVKILS